MAMADPSLIQLAPTASGPVWIGGQQYQLITLINQDATNTIYVGNQSSITVGGGNAVPIKPGGFLVYPGTNAVYAVAPNGTAPMSVVPGSVAASPNTLAINGNVNATVTGNVNISGQSVSLDVSAATVNINPALGYILPGNKGNLFQLGAAQNVPGNGSINVVSNADIRTYAAVDLSMTGHCTNQATVGAPLTLTLTLQWFDDAAGSNLIYQEDWAVWIGTNAASGRAFGTFPMRGQYLTVKVSNTGGQAATLDQCTITGTYRSVMYSSFRQLSPNMTITGAAISTFVQNFDNALVSIPNVTPNTGLRVYPLPLYAGPVTYYWQIATATMPNAPTLIDMSQATSGNLVAGTGQSGFIRALSNTINTPDSQTITFPRAPVALVINPAATTSIQFSAIGQQGF